MCTSKIFFKYTRTRFTMAAFTDCCWNIFKNSRPPCHVPRLVIEETSQYMVLAPIEDAADVFLLGVASSGPVDELVSSVTNHDMVDVNHLKNSSDGS